MDLGNIRKEYKRFTLYEDDVPDNPLIQFELWLNQALGAKVGFPTAMSLITIDQEGFPQSRIVLLKNFGVNGFTFFTNYNSSKGMAIRRNGAVGLHFFWPEFERQIRISGFAEKTSEKISDQYFYSRPVESQISAIVSNQSEKIPSRKTLEEAFNNFQKDKKTMVNRPRHWGGYIVKPVKIEFWQGRENRMHDRILYELKNESWIISRLAP